MVSQQPNHCTARGQPIVPLFCVPKQNRHCLLQKIAAAIALRPYGHFFRHNAEAATDHREVHYAPAQVSSGKVPESYTYRLP